jgi:hypothetical protein
VKQQGTATACYILFHAFAVLESVSYICWQEPTLTCKIAAVMTYMETTWPHKRSERGFTLACRCTGTRVEYRFEHVAREQETQMCTSA